MTTPEPLNIRRERARRAVTAALRAHGLDDPDKLARAVQAALDAADETLLRGALAVAVDGELPGLTVWEAAELLDRSPAEVEPLLTDGVARGMLVRVESRGVVRYAVPRVMT